jgi:hypothetical protein
VPGGTDAADPERLALLPRRPQVDTVNERGGLACEHRVTRQDPLHGKQRLLVVKRSRGVPSASQVPNRVPSAPSREGGVRVSPTDQDRRRTEIRKIHGTPLLISGDRREELLDGGRPEAEHRASANADVGRLRVEESVHEASVDGAIRFRRGPLVVLGTVS